MGKPKPEPGLRCPKHRANRRPRRVGVRCHHLRARGEYQARNESRHRRLRLAKPKKARGRCSQTQGCCPHNKDRRGRSDGKRQFQPAIQECGWFSHNEGTILVLVYSKRCTSSKGGFNRTLRSADRSLQTKRHRRPQVVCQCPHSKRMAHADVPFDAHFEQLQHCQQHREGFVRESVWLERPSYHLQTASALPILLERRCWCRRGRMALGHQP